MSEVQRSTEVSEVATGRTPPDRAPGVRSARATGWDPNAALDPGDSHDKGEQSLCVGEAA
jgi:hypothetical protein